jgi:ParB-like chromosome segregation protein Spo0J
MSVNVVPLWLKGKEPASLPVARRIAVREDMQVSVGGRSSVSVEYEKFKKTYAGFKSALAECSSDFGQKVYTKVDYVFGHTLRGENFLAQAVQSAVENDGVDRSDICKLMVHPKVKEAIVAMNVTANTLDERIKDFDSYIKRMTDLGDDLEKLDKAIAKDLKSRSKSSQSRDDIVALQKTVVEDLQRARTVVKETSSRIAKEMRSYGKDMVGEIRQIMSNSASKAKSGDSMIEQHKFFNERNLKAARGKAMTLFRQVHAACTEAVKLADTSKENALEQLKVAKGALSEVTAFVEDYEKVFQKHMKILTNRGSSPFPLEVRDLMLKGVEGGKKLYGTAAERLGVK